MVVVKGETKTVVAALGGLVLRISGVNALLLVWVLMVVVVVVVLLVAGMGCCVVVVVVEGVGLTTGGMVAGRFLVWTGEATVVVASFTEAVVVSCRGVRGGT